MLKQVEQALRIAADALDIAADRNVTNIQVNPPKEWNLEAFGENPDDGWCATRELASKLRELASKSAQIDGVWRPPRFLHKLRAKYYGYFWLPCPVCQRMFGGHEMGDVGLKDSDCRTWGVCPNCIEEAQKRNLENFGIE